ncbi:MAG: hypothetical protein C4303_10150, partial [candidate division GAL15 bacterium]
MRFGLAQIRYRWGESRSWEEGTTDNLDKAVEFIRRAGREGQLQLVHDPLEEQVALRRAQLLGVLLGVGQL